MTDKEMERADQLRRWIRRHEQSFMQAVNNYHDANTGTSRVAMVETAAHHATVLAELRFQLHQIESI